MSVIDSPIVELTLTVSPVSFELGPEARIVECINMSFLSDATADRLIENGYVAVAGDKSPTDLSGSAAQHCE